MTKVNDSRGVRGAEVRINKYSIQHKMDKDGTDKILKLELEIAGPGVNNVERELIRLDSCEPVKMDLLPIQVGLLNE